MTTEELLFLKESNNIEDIWDDDSLMQAILAWQELKNKVFTGSLMPSHIEKVQGMLLRNHVLAPKYKGKFRHDIEVTVGGRYGLDSSEVKAAMSRWCMNANDLFNDYVSDKITKRAYVGMVKMQHVEFEYIHPFADGNGRTGRMLMNWQLNIVNAPLMVIRYSERNEYYQWFKEDQLDLSGI